MFDIYGLRFLDMYNIIGHLGVCKCTGCNQFSKGYCCNNDFIQLGKIYWHSVILNFIHDKVIQILNINLLLIPSNAFYGQSLLILS